MKVLIRDFEMQKLCLDFNIFFWGARVGPVVVLVFGQQIRQLPSHVFFCLDDAQPCHDMELSLRNEDLPVDWESKMSQMLCFPCFSGVVG